MASNYLDILPVDLLDYVMKWKEFYEWEDKKKDKMELKRLKASMKKEELGLYKDEDEMIDDFEKYDDNNDVYYGHKDMYTFMRNKDDKYRKEICKGIYNVKDACLSEYYGKYYNGYFFSWGPTKQYYN